MKIITGIQNVSAQNFGMFTSKEESRGNNQGIPPFKLDRVRHLAVHSPRKNPNCPSLFSEAKTSSRERWRTHIGG